MTVASARRPGARSSQRAVVPDPPLQDPLAEVVRWWPLRTFLDLGAYPEAVPCARGHAKNVVWEWGFGELARTCELIVSEICTNAVKASRALGEHTTVRLWLLSDKVDVVMAVWDASHRPPVPVEKGERELDEGGGLGLLLVKNMSAQWGWHFTGETGGKVVWALCRHQ
jgi:anti-sigma regulatory factor (Ser/Thr protein kinase)